MSSIRRALFWSTADRYLCLALNVAVLAIVSRILTPKEIGLSVLGAAVIALAEALRDFGSTNYIIQRQDLTRDATRTVFTITLLLSMFIGGGLIAFANPIAILLGEKSLVSYVQVVASAFLVTPFAAPIMAIMRREMDFRSTALINVASTAVYAVIAVCLALRGASYMSFAWALLASSMVSTGLALWLRPLFWIFRPTIEHSRNALAFGGYSTATALLNKAFEQIPTLVLGRILGLDAVGFYSRAQGLCQLPDKVILPGVISIALPAFSSVLRDGKDLKVGYLRALSFVTAVQWPALIMVALLAHPLVNLLLGHQWLTVAPLVQIMAAASLLFFPATLSYPILASTGGIRDTAVSSLITLPLSAVILVAAANFGILAVATSMFLTVPAQVYVVLWFIRRRIHFTWRELATAVRPSAIAAALSATGPLLVTATWGSRDLPIWATSLAIIFAGLMWVVGMLAAQHPLVAEVRYWHWPRQAAQATP